MSGDIQPMRRKNIGAPAARPSCVPPGIVRPFATPPRAPGLVRARGPQAAALRGKGDGASQTAAISPLRQSLLDILLNTTIPLARHGACALKPLWVNEAMHRALNIARLVRELENKAPLGPDGLNHALAEHQLAFDLADAFSSLALADDTGMQPCFNVLQVVVFNLVELFGPAFGTVFADMSLERLTLPAHKRRALVLATCELVLNALRHGLTGRGMGNITVSLRRTARATARLSVEDDGRGMAGAALPPGRGIAADLAAVLEAELTYHTGGEGGTVAQLSFPVAALV